MMSLFFIGNELSEINNYCLKLFYLKEHYLINLKITPF